MNKVQSLLTPKGTLIIDKKNNQLALQKDWRYYIIIGKVVDHVVRSRIKVPRECSDDVVYIEKTELWRYLKSGVYVVVHDFAKTPEDFSRFRQCALSGDGCSCHLPPHK